MNTQPFRARMSAIEKRLIIRLLTRTSGRLGVAAQLSGMRPFALRRIAIRHGLQGYISRDTTATKDTSKPFRDHMREKERRIVLDAIKKADGSIARAARELHLSIYRLRRIVERHQLEGHLRRHTRPPVFAGNAAWNSLADA